MRLAFNLQAFFQALFYNRETIVKHNLELSYETLSLHLFVFIFVFIAPLKKFPLYPASVLTLWFKHLPVTYPDKIWDSSFIKTAVSPSKGPE